MTNRATLRRLPPLLKTQAQVIESNAVDVETFPIGSVYRNKLGREVQDLPKLFRLIHPHHNTNSRPCRKLLVESRLRRWSAKSPQEVPSHSIRFDRPIRLCEFVAIPPLASHRHWSSCPSPWDSALYSRTGSCFVIAPCGLAPTLNASLYASSPSSRWRSVPPLQRRPSRSNRFPSRGKKPFQRALHRLPMVLFLSGAWGMVESCASNRAQPRPPFSSNRAQQALARSW